ncbi:tyrosine-type recombinase/integrase [Caulobacter sp. FWC2]|uniref:tyrosine-type recombinase/integrase n=1 Tax=Caulobacter sp. FWC2 TaxID=69664 RepID=UPI001E372045|nr:tyrosine-type recombinase/integrase [Caulobacter sp. FWC2]
MYSPDGSQALHEEVVAIIAELDRVDVAQTPIAGTIGGLLRTYNRSTDFLALSRATQRDYQRRIDEIEADFGDVLLGDVTLAFTNGMNDVWARRGHRVANMNMQVLKNALLPAVIDGRLAQDPFRLIKKVKRPHDKPEKNPIWETGEFQAVVKLALDRKMPGLARALALARYGGFRRGTICKLPLNARTRGFDDQGREEARLYWLTEKRRVVCDKPEDPRLTALLDSTPNQALTIAYNARKAAFNERALNQAIDRLIDALATTGKIRPNLTLHGLRHTRGVELATAGASDAEIMSQLEHTSTRAAEIYRRQADRRGLANSGQAKIDQAIARQIQKAKKSTAH